MDLGVLIELKLKLFMWAVSTMIYEQPNLKH